jgi:MFS family permease
MTGEGRLFDRDHRAVTIGVVAAMTMFAFEGIGVITAMPVIAERLDGLNVYGWAFNAYMMASLIGIVVAGDWADRSGPRVPFLAGLALFGVGAIMAALAWSMPILIAARFVQGFGGGVGIVTVYVVLGRAFPDYLRPRAFALLSASWVIPSMVGPFISGVLVEYVSWRAVFWIVVPFIIPPALLLAPRLRGFKGTPHEAGTREGRTLIALTAAAGLGLVQESGVRRGLTGLALVGAGAAILVATLRSLLPKGALVFARGLPTTVMLRGLLAASFFGAETFVPLALRTIRDVGPTAAGLVVSLGAVGWAVGSHIQGRAYGRIARSRLIQFGSLAVGVSIVSLAAVMIPAVPVALAGGAWIVGAIGMGLCFGAIGTLTLEQSNPGEEGFNSAALQICDSVGSVLAIAAAGAIFAAAEAANMVTGWTFVALWWVTAAVAFLAVIVAPRVNASSTVTA